MRRRAADHRHLDDVLSSRVAADHRHLDDVLSSRVAAEDAELTAVSRVTLLDRLLRPFNRLGTKRFLAEAREKVGATPSRWTGPAGPGRGRTRRRWPSSNGSAPPGWSTSRPGARCCAGSRCTASASSCPGA